MKQQRKMLSDLEAPYIKALMRLIVTQNKKTIGLWCTAYAQKHILPLYEKFYPNDPRPAGALTTAGAFLTGSLPLTEVKAAANACRLAAKEAGGNAAAQGAARAVETAVMGVYNTPSALGLALYGALAIAYDKLGEDAPWEVLLKTAEAECEKMRMALAEIAVPDEQNHVKIDWNC